MKRTRRDVLHDASTLSAVLAGLGLAGAASAQETPEWDPDAVYTSGDRVTYDGAVWEAQWWTQGDEPGVGSGPWEQVEDDGGEDPGEYPEWDPDAVYTGGDRVVHDGYVWEASWWTQGDEPGSGEWGPWEQIEEHDPPDGPTASFAVSPSEPEPGEAVTFDAIDSEGTIESYEWDLGDGTTATGEVVEHAYDGADEYDVTLTVTDAADETDSASTTVTVTDGPSEGPTASFTTDPASPEPGENVEFDASASEGEIESYAWDFGDGTSASGEVVEHAYDEEGEYDVTLAVTDAEDLTDETSETVDVAEGGDDVTPETTLEAFYPEYDKDFYPDETEGGVPGLLENELHEDATEYGADVDAIENDADDGSMELGALGDRGFELVQRFDADGVPRETTARLTPWLTGLAEETEPIPFNDGSGRDGGLTADAGPVSATNDPSTFVQDAWPSGDQFDDVYHQSERADWSSGVSDSQYNNADNPIVDATTNKEHPVTGESLGDGFSANAPLEATAELHGDGWIFDQALIFENTSDVPLLIDGAVIWWVGPSKGGTGLDQFSYDNAQRKNFSVGHPQRDVIEVALPADSKPGPFEGTDAPLSAYGVRMAQHNNPYMYRTLYPNQQFSMTYQNVTGPGQYDWPVDDLVDVLLETCHVEFREDMSSIEQNTELVDTLDMKNRYGN